MAERHSSHSMGWKVGSQSLVVDFQAGCLVEDAGLLVVRELDVSLGDLAARLPDPRAPLDRYLHGYTRREALLPREDRPSLLDQRRAQIERLEVVDESSAGVVRRQPSATNDLAAETSSSSAEHELHGT